MWSLFVGFNRGFTKMGFLAVLEFFYLLNGAEFPKKLFSLKLKKHTVESNFAEYVNPKKTPPKFSSFIYFC